MAAGLCQWPSQRCQEAPKEAAPDTAEMASGKDALLQVDRNVDMKELFFLERMVQTLIMTREGPLKPLVQLQRARSDAEGS